MSKTNSAAAEQPKTPQFALIGDTYQSAIPNSQGKFRAHGYTPKGGLHPCVWIAVPINEKDEIIKLVKLTKDQRMLIRNSKGHTEVVKASDLYYSNIN